MFPALSHRFSPRVADWRHTKLKLVCAVVVVMCMTMLKQGNQDNAASLTTGRNLKAPGIENHECAVGKYAEIFERQFGGHVWEFVFLMYLFMGMAVLIDTHFVFALENIASSVQLPEHVVGATFMSVANASPESFISVVSTVAHGRADTGLATVIGACMFNILVCVGASILASEGATFQVHPIATLRDLIAYFISLGFVLILFLQGTVQMWQAVVLMLGYPTYMIGLIVYYRFFAAQEAVEEEGDTEGQETDPLLDKEAGEEVVEYQDYADIPWYLRLLNALAFPWQMFFKLFFWDAMSTMFYLQFCLSLLCIMLLSYVIVMLVHRLECGFEISGDLIGLTVLAIGVATPDVLSNAIVARQGYADMALSAALGSNVTALAAGLGLPWLILIVQKDEPVKLNSAGVKTAVIILCATFMLFALSIWASHLVLTKYHAYVFFAYYGIFMIVIVSGVLEENIAALV